MTYFFCRNSIKRIAVAWTVFVIICIVGTPLRECYGGQPLLWLGERNFYNGMLGILHIGNGALVVLSMSGMLLSLISERLVQRTWQFKIIWAAIIAIAFEVLALVSHRFWIIGKIEATPVWVFTIIAISVLLYTILHCLAQASITRWFAPLRPAGTATLTVYIMPYVFYACSSLTGIVLPDCLTHGIIGIANCLCFSLIVITVTGILERLHIKLKI